MCVFCHRPKGPDGGATDSTGEPAPSARGLVRNPRGRACPDLPLRRHLLGSRGDAAVAVRRLALSFLEGNWASCCTQPASQYSCIEPFIPGTAGVEQNESDLPSFHDMPLNRVALLVGHRCQQARHKGTNNCCSGVARTTRAWRSEQTC